jgi:hypothetical protein
MQILVPGPEPKLRATILNQIKFETTSLLDGATAFGNGASNAARLLSHNLN